MQHESVFRAGIFEGKVAVVTGGGTGIGFAISSELLSLGCNVVIASRTEETLADAVKRLAAFASHGARVSYVVCSIKDEDQVKALFTEVIDRHSRLDFLVNNGGGQFMSPTVAMNAKGFKAVVDTNLLGTFLCCKEAFIQYMRENGGSIVNITAAPHFSMGFPSLAHTAAARAGVDNLTKSLSVEWAPCKVRINCVAPGGVYSATAEANYDPAVGPASVWPFMPAKRIATVQEVSSAVMWLLSPGAAYVSGHPLVVDGAWSNVTSTMPIAHTSEEPWPAYGPEESNAPRPEKEKIMHHRIGPSDIHELLMQVTFTSPTGKKSRL